MQGHTAFLVSSLVVAAEATAARVKAVRIDFEKNMLMSRIG
jgi:hypothetical protein